jgi:MFS family permease
VTSRLRPAHGVALLFLANGLSHPSLWPRFPEIRDAVGATDATLGLALLGTGVGGVLGSMLAPLVTRRLGTARAATVTAVALALATMTVGVAPSVLALFGAFALMGVSDGVADISQNALMFDVQRTGERSLASRMHAVWSLGALGGTAIGTAAATVGVSVLAQTAVLAVVATGLVVAARGAVGRVRTGITGSDTQLPATHPPSTHAPAAAPPAAAPSVAAAPAAAAPVDASRVAGPGAVAPPDASGSRPGRPRRRRPRTRAWLLLAVAGLVVAAVEAVANEWSALALRDGLGASVTVAGLGPTAFAGAMLVGRLVGDRGIDRLGSRAVARLGAGAVAAGGGLGLWLAAWLEVPAVLVAGLVVAGIGAATLFPLMLAAGDRLDATGRGVAVGSLSARTAFLTVPVAMGLISDAAGPAVAFALLPAAGAIALVVLPAALGRGPDH